MHQFYGSKRLASLFAAALLLGAHSASAGTFDYDGVATICTTTCDSFNSLSPPPDATTLTGSQDIEAGASDTWTFADVGNFSFLALSPAAPLEPYDGTNPATANPLPINSAVAVVRASGMAGAFTTGGTTDASGNLDSGTILYEFTVPPFSSNAAWVIFDVGTGTAQVCLFFEASGCLPGATETVVIEGSFERRPAATYDYAGDITLCTGTCDSFASLSGPPEASSVAGDVTIDVNTDAADTFSFADVGDFDFLVQSPAAPLEPFDGTNPATANPLPINSAVAVVRESGMMGAATTGGTTDATGELDSGTILFEFTVPPFSSNGAWVVFDVGTGTAQVCLFFDTSGCIPGATEAVIIAGAFALSVPPDTDGDGVTDDVDNCIETANADQRDSNGDGYGNICDTDITNDCITNVIDLGLLRTVFFTNDADADFTGDGVVNAADLGVMKSRFFTPPGPGQGACP